MQALSSDGERSRCLLWLQLILPWYNGCVLVSSFQRMLTQVMKVFWGDPVRLFFWIVDSRHNNHVRSTMESGPSRRLASPSKMCGWPDHYFLFCLMKQDSLLLATHSPFFMAIDSQHEENLHAAACSINIHTRVNLLEYVVMNLVS